jgi:predicted XRE-type DNA-binding protein
MKSQTFKSVWDAIENTPEEAENMKLRSALMRDLQRYIAARGWKQAEAAEVFHVTQPRISDLLRGKVSLFSLDTLVNMVAAAGLHIDMQVMEPA